MISIMCRFPGLASLEYQFLEVPLVGDKVFLVTSGSSPEEWVVEKREFTALRYPKGYINTSIQPSVCLVMRNANETIDSLSLPPIRM